MCEGVWSDALGDGWHPEVSGEGAVDGLEGAKAVLAGRVEVGAHAEPGRGTVLGLVTAGDLQLGLDRPQCPFAAVVGERHVPGIVRETEDVVGPVTQALKEVAGRGLFPPRHFGVEAEADGDAPVEGFVVQQE